MKHRMVQSPPRLEAPQRTVDDWLLAYKAAGQLLKWAATARCSILYTILSL